MSRVLLDLFTIIHRQELPCGFVNSPEPLTKYCVCQYHTSTSTCVHVENQQEKNRIVLIMWFNILGSNAIQPSQYYLYYDVKQKSNSFLHIDT